MTSGQNSSVRLPSAILLELLRLCWRLEREKQGWEQEKAWVEIGKDEIRGGETLRTAAQRWLSQRKILHSTLTTSSNKGHTTLIGRCSRCLQCNTAWCFSFQRPSTLIAEKTGGCFGPLNVKKTRQQNASDFAKQYTPGRGLVKMMEDDVPLEERLKIGQLRNRRPALKGQMGLVWMSVCSYFPDPEKPTCNPPKTCLQPLRTDAPEARQSRMCQWTALERCKSLSMHHCQG